MTVRITVIRIGGKVKKYFSDGMERQLNASYIGYSHTVAHGYIEVVTVGSA